MSDGFDCVAKVMSKARYEKLTQYLHIADDSDNPARGQAGHDSIAKIRPLFDMAVKHFQQRYHPNRELSVDEAMIGFKGRLNFKQYMPGKPQKWGIKVWELANSKNGYVLNMQVYTGKDAFDERSGQGLGRRVVDFLTKPVQNKFHHVYFDNFFSSVDLLEHLEENDTYACSTVRINRKGLPPEIKKANPKVPGQTVKMQKGNLLATVWFDKRKVALISTCQNPGDQQIERPRAREGRPKQISKPTAIINYKKFMGGVDLSDQMRSYYPMGRESKKWWKYLLWFITDLCIINSFILYQETLPEQLDDGEKVENKQSHLIFRLQVARSLIGGFSNQQKAGRKRKQTIEQVVVAEANLGVHKLVKLEGRKKVCSARKRKTPAGRGVETSFQYCSCSVPLCKKGCFAEFHREHMI